MSKIIAIYIAASNSFHTGMQLANQFYLPIPILLMYVTPKAGIVGVSFIQP